MLPADAADPVLGASLARLREVPLIGREEEQRELRELVDQVVETGQPQLLMLVGEPGIGKSRLARWGLSHVEREGAMEGAAGGYDPSGADVAGGLRHALRRLLGMSTTAQTSLAWLDAVDREELTRYLEGRDEEAPFTEERVVRLAHATLRSVGAMRPIYLWLDDLAWARDGALSLVESLLDAGDVPMLVVATMRSGSMEHATLRERMARLTQHPRTRTREVDVLDAEPRARLLSETAELAPGLAREIADRVDGSPLLLVQLVQDWLACGLLEPEGTRYRTRGGASVDELLVSRPLASLVEDRATSTLASFGDPRAEEIIGRAALLGIRFERAALQSACAEDAALSAALDGVLDHALLVGMLRSEGAGVYAFDHGLLHEALVARVERSETRQSALVDAANGLMLRYGKERGDIAAIVADLLLRAGYMERAWERILRACSRAGWSGDYAAALRYIDVAREWLEHSPERAFDVEFAMGQANYFSLRYDDALAASARAREVALNDTQRAKCDSMDADVLFYMDRFAESQAIAQQLLARFGESEDPDDATVAGRAVQRLADLAAMRDDFEAQLAYRELGVERTAADGAAFRIFVSRMNLAEALALVGRTEEALRIVDEELRGARARKDEEGTAAAVQFRAQICAIIGRGGEVRDVLERARDELRGGGDRWRYTAVCAHVALISATEGDEADAVEDTEAFLSAYRAVPHDESATIAAMHELSRQLERRGLRELSLVVAALLEARRERARRGFATPRQPV